MHSGLAVIPYKWASLQISSSEFHSSEAEQRIHNFRFSVPFHDLQPKKPNHPLFPFLYFAFASIEESSSQTGWELEHNNPFPNGPPILSYLLDNFSNNHALLYQ